MSKLNTSLEKLEAFGKGLLAFGHKNATTLMTGGGIILGWVGVYVFWKEGKKAEEKIRAEEEKLKETKSEQTTLPTKDKLTIYLQYCWLALVLGLGSTALSLYSQKLNLDEIAKYALIAQLYKGKNEELEAQILKEKDGEKKLQKLKQSVYKDKYPVDEMEKDLNDIPGEGRTLFIDTTTGARWKGDITEMTNHIAEFNDLLKSQWEKQAKRKLGDAFYVHDGPFPDDLDIYVSEDLSVFLEAIGELKYGNDVRIGDLLEFRYYGGGDLLKPKQILDYEKFKDPNTGVPALCYVAYDDLAAPTNELIERNPL